MNWFALLTIDCAALACSARFNFLTSVVLVLGLATPSHAERWQLAEDFSAVNNPNGAWTFGSKSVLSAGISPFTNNTRVASQYATSQLAGWSDPALGVFPYIVANVSEQEWVYNGTSVGGGVAVLRPHEVMAHPFSPSNRLSVVQWSTPYTSIFSIDVELRRIEQVEGPNSSYFVLLNGLQLPGGSGILTGFATPSSSAQYTNPRLLLQSGDRIEIAIGHGLDGNSNTDGTIIRATITAVPEPVTLLYAAIGLASVLAV